MNIVINGDFLMHKITGVQRYALEVTKAMDRLLDDHKNVHIELVLPSNCHKVLKLKNIEVVKYKKYKRLIWLQLDLMKYCQRKNAVCLCMATPVPFFYANKSMNVIHDAATLVHPEFYSKKYLLMNKILVWGVIKRLKKVITVSHFSKEEIVSHTHIASDQVVVAYNSYEHFDSVKCDYTILDQLGIKRNQYFYALSSLSPNKNFQWILKEAERNPQEIFVISGMKINLFADNGLNMKPDNVIFTGYISDAQVKALLSACKTFLFPTFYEGFGIPPLEALSCGAKITISDTPVMHEVYGKCAHYINPFYTNYQGDDLLGKNEGYQEVLKKYSWQKTAAEIIKVLEQG